MGTGQKQNMGTGITIRKCLMKVMHQSMFFPTTMNTGRGVD